MALPKPLESYLPGIPSGGEIVIADLADQFEAATATSAGIVELATSAETITGTDATRAVTPAGLAAKTASLTAAGIVELATTAEASTGTSEALAVTPKGLKTVADTKLTIPTPSALIADPTGGATTDAEARTAIAAILDLLIAQGLMAAS